MTRHPIGRATWGMILALGLSRAVIAQGPPGPPDVNNLAHQMAERVRHLGEDIESDLGQTPQGRHLVTDTQELAQAVDEFHEAIHDRPNPYQLRQSYSGIDATWHHLRSMLSKPGFATPAVDRAAARVDELDAQLHQVLGLNPYPDGYFGAEPPPSGMPQVRRLAHALVDRAEGLVLAVQSGMAGDPEAAALARDAAELARRADAFHDAIDRDADLAAVAPQFGPVDALADQVERFVTTQPVPPPVRQAWQSFASAEVLMHQALGLDSPQPDVAVSALPPAGGGPSPVGALADRLAQQVDALLEHFGPTAGVVPQGRQMLADIERLQAAVTDFRRDAAAGLDPNRLAFEFRDTFLIWQRLARRVDRLARGRTGPNINQVQQIGSTLEQLHRALVLPGYAPVPGMNPAGGPTLPNPGVPIPR
jgi:hypothetical protein